MTAMSRRLLRLSAVGFAALAAACLAIQLWGVDVELIRWDEQDGPQVLLGKSLGCAGGWLEMERGGDGLILRSNCDLSAKGCEVFETLERTRTWRWTEAGGLSGPID